MGMTCPEANASKSDLTLEEYLNLCKEVLENFFELVKDVAQIASKPKFEGRSIQMLIEPKSE